MEERWRVAVDPFGASPDGEPNIFVLDADGSPVAVVSRHPAWSHLGASRPERAELLASAPALRAEVARLRAERDAAIATALKACEWDSRWAVPRNWSACSLDGGTLFDAARDYPEAVALFRKAAGLPPEGHAG